VKIRGDIQRDNRAGGAQARYGFFLGESLVTLTIGLGLLMMLGAVIVKQHHQEKILAERRTAVRACEDAVLTLRSGKTLGTDAGENVQVENLADAAPAGMRWVRVRAMVGGKKEAIVALLPGESR